MNHINLFNDLETHCVCILGVCVCVCFLMRMFVTLRKNTINNNASNEIKIIFDFEIKFSIPF